MWSYLPVMLVLLAACNRAAGPKECFVDADGDGFGDPDLPTWCTEQPVENAADCDDSEAVVNPGQPERPYDGVDNDCDPETPDDDIDGDGYSSLLDCDDTNSQVNPNIAEVAYDGLDNDCDPSTSDDDLDDDGYDNEHDCNDGDGAVHGFGAIAGPVTRSDLVTVCDSRCTGQTTVEGDVVLFDEDGAAPTTTLAGLHCISAVTGKLSIQATALATLQGLDEVTTIGEVLALRDNPVLDDVSALSNVESLGGLVLDGNRSLASLDGLRGLEELSGPLTVFESPTLTSLDGLSGIETVDGAIRVEGNTALERLTLPRLTRSGDVFLANNGELEALDGLGMLRSIHGSLRIEEMAALESLESLAALTEVTGDLVISNNPRLSKERAATFRDGLTDFSGLATIRDNGLILGFDNVGFEAQAPSSESPAEWLVFPESSPAPRVTTGTPYYLSNETFTAFEGGASLKMYGNFGDPAPTGFTAVYQEFSDGFRRGDVFEITGFAYLPTEELLQTPCNGYLVVKFFRADFTFIQLMASTPVDTTSQADEWLGQTVSAEVPEEAAFMQAGVEYAYSGNCAGALFWDTMAIRLATP